ncbi:hypothetical protein [Rhodococcus aetherivorans]|uniref:hypothetical protein n=1 Tax=Rhodococcus aetherivorans TaxID=191292 RepID=UPI000AE64281|nr:hypothetical protein [Rhodococcus aetherivorans]
MEWFALSSKFYIDLDDQGVSEAAQTLLVRALAYMADNETSGYLSKTALKKFGLRSVSRRVDELIRNGIMTESCDGFGYDFPAWFKWNEPLERQVKKRKADRDRIRKKREKDENVARQSRGVSRDVASPQRHKHSSTYVEESPHVSNARRPRGGREVAERLNATAHTPEAHAIARAYETRVGKVPGDTLAKIAQAADGCLQSGYTPEQIAAGIDAWAASDMTSPTQIANFVFKATNRPNGVRDRPSTTDQRIAATQALKTNPGTWPGPLELT